MNLSQSTQETLSRLAAKCVEGEVHHLTLKGPELRAILVALNALLALGEQDHPVFGEAAAAARTIMRQLHIEEANPGIRREQ